MENKDTLIPEIGVISDVKINTPDIKTFRVVTRDGKKLFEHMPGQCAMLSVPGVGEAMFSITSSPTNKDYLEFSIKKCGCVTELLHSLEVGEEIGVRGPYGRPFPVDTEFRGKDLLFIAGGVGLAPLRSVINYCRHYRENYGKIDIVYGARTQKDLLDYNEIVSKWAFDKDVSVHLTVDIADKNYTGHVGFVPSYVEELGFDCDKTAILCGPPVMIKFTLDKLTALGFTRDKIYTTLELKMKCGVGKCGRCNVGSRYVCKDGPVFRLDELDLLPDEY